MSFRYESGKEIKKGDHITYAGKPGYVEFIADPASPDSQTEWYIQEFGGGVMIVVPNAMGHVFLTDTDCDEDLSFCER